MSPFLYPNPLTRTVQLTLTTIGLASAPIPLLAQENNTTDLNALVVSATALKVETPLVETPRPASVVTEEELRERNVQSLDETFQYRAGVVSGHYGEDNDTDWLQVRGFDQATYQDGLRIYRTGFYEWMVEPFGLERVELLKGPASILYGEAPPGGVVNAISKRPRDTAQGEVDIQVGTDEHRQLGIDTTGPLGERDDLSYRLVSLYRYQEGDLDFTENERYYLAPSLTWDISDQTSLTVLSSFQKDDAVPTNPFKLAYGTIEGTPYGKVDPSTNYSEPGYDTNERTQTSVGYALSHAINDVWRFEQDFRYSESDLLLRSSFIVSQSQSNPREGSRGLIYRDGETRSWTVDNRLVGTWYTDRTENTFLFGVDYQDLNNKGAGTYTGFGDPIDLFDPQYGNFTPIDTSTLTHSETDKQQTGYYLQHQLRLDDRWVFLAGARYDQAELENSDLTAGTQEGADNDQVSLSGGIMYLAANGISPYLSYTESFEPIASTDGSGDLYDPRTGEQLEAGVKIAPRGMDGYLTAAAYRIEEENSLGSTLNNGIRAQDAERTTTGFEVESVSYLTDQLELTAAYTYSDATVKSDANSEERQAPLIPRHQASAWLDYTFTDLAPGLKLGGGARFVGETRDGSTKVPSYTVFDMMAQFAFAPQWQAQLNVTNVADREYVASCSGYCYYGAERSVVGSVRYRW
ncbi:TonB-dependent siderophore receptor [Marinobacter persicus]|uniref:Iron complex outermembrane receptor protein n=1 Tax=Marinobacter persicus TaxID=930118 RepID=A0A2S6G2R2_9GAMM|nr:TonB-dependent siderophore receptor [Marinobacter persicus]PPK49957.1 iron complex outermembrane receptor protein [Marinobacter persicus]PPK51874.1 iron complex outermembrane receptor protein [Marinobacter persicus]PPK56541.1 iron complex outermembrane receptor protein [Marinobacter persicus]